MNNVAIAFLTKDRTDLSVQTIQPLLQADKFDLFWIDGSVTEAGVTLWNTTAWPGIVPSGRLFHNVRGGPDAAIVFALTTMLQNEQYDYVGLVENDVLLDDDWFKPTMDLFDPLEADELRIGAVSPRAYEDRILIQRDGYAVMHNLGAGCVLFSRRAAQLILDNYRTGFTLDNRAVFNQRSGIDIGSYWAFHGQSHFLTADWHFDTVLARNGLCSLALTPAKCTMIGQTLSLEEQGLILAGKLIPAVFRSHAAFDRFCDTSREITAAPPIYCNQGQSTYFSHQLHRLGAIYEGAWRLKWAQGFGPFVWEAASAEDGSPPALTVPLAGVCEILVSGGQSGAKVELVDTHSGYSCDPTLSPESATGVMCMPVPSGVSYRNVTLKALSPGAVFYGIRTFEPQVFLRDPKPFDHSMLPPPAG